MPQVAVIMGLRPIVSQSRPRVMGPKKLDGERQEMDGQVTILDVEELLDDEAVGEEDGVEEEGLADHEGEGEEGALAIFAEHGVEDVAPGGVIADGEFEFVAFGSGEALWIAALFACDGLSGESEAERIWLAEWAHVRTRMNGTQTVSR